MLKKAKKKIKKHEELSSKIRDLVRLITKNSDHFDEKYLKIKFNWDDNLPLDKTTEILSMIIAVRAAFHENIKCYFQVFLDECPYKLWIIYQYYILIELMHLKIGVFRQYNKCIKKVWYLSLLVFLKQRFKVSNKCLP